MNLRGSFDWSAPRFLPLTLDVHRDGVKLKAGGQSVALDGALFRLDADGALDGRWAVRQGDFLVVSLALTPQRDTVLREVTWFAGEWSGERIVSSTGLQDNVLFLRKGGVSFFLSLDFPYSKITPTGISYPPHELLPAGKTHSCHTISVGACRLSGVRIGDLDRAEIEAVSTYVEQRFPQRFERPMMLGACITNRFTDCRDGRIFYTMHDNPTLSLSPELLEEELKLMAELGVEYYQVFEGVFDWPDDKRTGPAYRRLRQLAKRRGVRIGDYAVLQGLYCPHYNYSHRNLTQPDWLIRKADGNPGGYCLGCREYVESFRDKLIAHNRTHRTELICFDFLGLQPCHAASHGHPVGDLYQQVRALVAICEELAALNPRFLIWPNSGNWSEFMPKLTWFTPNVYLTDPHLRRYAPTLNLLKLLGDGRREQMVTTHDRQFVPWRNFTNCEYYAFPRSRVHDIHFFEYSFLQGLAVTPNICFGEARTFLDRVPSRHREHCIGFIQKWLNVVRAHFDVWQHTARIGDAPGIGSAEIYAHVASDRGFVCLLNQNPFPRTTRFWLDGSVGLSQGEHFQLREVYPRECLIAEQPLPFARFGDAIDCTLPAHSVRFIEIRPHVPQPSLQIHGLPAHVRPTATGYRLTLRAPQGETARLGVVLPKGKTLATVSAQQTPTVPMYTFPASARIVRRQGNVAQLEVTFPREKAPRALTRWHVSPGDVAIDLPLVGQCPFLGGLITNAFSEELEVQLDLTTKPGKTLGRLYPASVEPATVAFPPAKRHVFTTDFTLPFIEASRWGTMPGYDDDTVLELAFTDPASVAAIRARLNGAPAEVRRYDYHKNKDWHSWYIELTGRVAPGKVQLAVEVDWA